VNSYDVRQKKKPLPPWVLEKGPFIVLFLFGALYLLFMRSDPKPKGPVPVPHAKLVVVQPPAKTWVEGSDTLVKSIEVKVRNEGDSDAQHVVIQAIVRGQVFAMTGKDSLPIGETASFVGQPATNLHVADSIEFKLDCGTCSPFATPGH
jgi:hypothetical protein